MLKLILNTLLSLILGKLKPVLLKHISEMDKVVMAGEDKRKAVLANIKEDLKVAGKDIAGSVLNLAVEAGVSLLKGRLK